MAAADLSGLSLSKGWPKLYAFHGGLDFDRLSPNGVGDVASRSRIGAPITEWVTTHPFAPTRTGGECRFAISDWAPSSPFGLSLSKARPKLRTSPAAWVSTGSARSGG